MIAIDELRKIATKKPSSMGLGVIKLITTNGAYRFYCNDIIPITVNLHHTHSNSFKSSIQKGILRNLIYDLTEVKYETDLRLTQSKCHKSVKPETVAENVVMTETVRFDIAQGGEYEIDYKTFHRVEYVTPKVITLITVTEIAPVHPYFTADKRVPQPDPWPYTKTENQCWEGIEYILADD